jgi:hypothetical protein
MNLFALLLLCCVEKAFMFIPRLKTVTVSVIFVLLISCFWFVTDFVGYGDLVLQENGLYFGIVMFVLLVFSYAIESKVTKLIIRLIKLSGIMKRP